MYKELYGAKSGAVTIEVHDLGQPGASGIEVENLLKAVQAVAQIGAESMESMPKEKRPSEAQLCFGMVALSSGEFAICLKELEASIKVNLKWTLTPNPGEIVDKFGAFK